MGVSADAIVVVQPSQQRTVRRFLNETYSGTVKFVLECVKSEDGRPLGTADVLRRIRGKLTSDFLVVSGDIVSDAPLALLADVHRLRDASVTVLLAPPVPGAEEAKAAAVDKKGKKDKDAKVDVDNINSYFVGLDPSEALPLLPATEADGTVTDAGHSHRLLFIAAAADIEEDFPLKKSLLRRYGARMW
jgi:NDP-sugar pyrophosphorylase family protein